MKAHVAAFGLILMPLAFLLGAGAQGDETTQPSAPTLTARQQNLLLQLSDAEANIQAINKALVLTGYKVGQAYERIDSSRKGTELMDRNGGGPVRWDQFYGRAATDFYYHPTSDLRVRNGGHDLTSVDAHVNGDPLTLLGRPQQFELIYRANSDQIARAREQIASLRGNQAALLARRQKHETDQSRLWAVIAFEQVKDREIEDEPLCRFQLKASAGQSIAQRQALQAAILFLRTADQVSIDGLDSVESDQEGVFADVETRMKAAYATLHRSLADALLPSDVRPSDRSQVESLKGLCKKLDDECEVIADNYHNALDRDQAKEDNSKLQFRAALQESLAAFSTDVADLDGNIDQTAKAWKVEPQVGVATTDAVPGRMVAKSAGRPSGVERPFSTVEGTGPERPEGTAVDLLQPGTVWVGDGKSLTVLERNGGHFRARFENSPQLVRMLSGTIKDGKVSWLAKDVEILKGSSPGGDNTGIIAGKRIDFTWHGPNTKRGSFSLQLEEP